jgi:hypothetical protein
VSERTLHEKPVMIHGHAFIRMKSGRHLTFWDCLGAAERADTDMHRAVSRAFKLALAETDADIREYDLERLEWFIDSLESYAGSLREHLGKHRTVHSKRERIALLRNVSGRTPEEAAEFLRKADELEAQL